MSEPGFTGLRDCRDYESGCKDFVRKQVRDIAAISVITRAEVLTGFEPFERIIAAEFLDCFLILEIDKNIADLAAKLRYDHKWKLPDALQAAIA